MNTTVRAVLPAARVATRAATFGLALTALPAVFAADEPAPAPLKKPEPATESVPASSVVPATTDAGSVDAIELSPFTVSTEKDSGYFAANTLAGSRLNANLADLGSSITVVTKQQLMDLGASDMNDVFLYEANTEGARNYTPITVDRNGLKDNLAGQATNGGMARNADTANRVRGLAAPDMSWNNYSAIARARSDTYNAQSIEISRGPNAILAGLGSPAGIVNQSMGTALINKNTVETDFKAGSWGSYRLSANFNKTIIRDKLAIYGAALYDNREFSRKPSVDLSKRQTVGVTYRPFRTTKIKAFYENYDNFSRLPNAMTPRDGISYWKQNGRPVWNPLTRRVTWLDRNNAVSDPYLLTSTAVSSAGTTLTGDAVLLNVASPRWVPGLGDANYARPVWAFSNDGSYLWYQRQAGILPLGMTTAQTNAFIAGIRADPTKNDIYERRMFTTSLPVAPYQLSASTSGFIAPAISDKSLYDYETVNIAAVNFGLQNTKTYNVDIEQQLTKDLFLSLGWFRQNYNSYEYYPVAQQQTTTVNVDINQYLSTGEVNPNYLRPYIEDIAQDTVRNPENQDIYRAMLAYDLDFTDKGNWLQWLGKHKILGLAEQLENERTFYRNRLTYIDPTDSNFFITPQASRAAGYSFAQNSANLRKYYYVGDNTTTVNQAPTTLSVNPGLGETFSGAIRTYNWNTNRYEDVSVTLGSELFAANGLDRFQKEIRSKAIAVHSFWLKNRLVTMFGVRQDDWRGRDNTVKPTTNVMYGNNYRVIDQNSILNNFGSWENISGTTKTMSAILTALKWDGGDLRVGANKADNFNPPAQKQIDIFGNALPKPVGEGEDYFIQISALNNKLYFKANYFENQNKFDRNGLASTLLGRLARMDNSTFLGWAQTIVRIQDGQNPSASDFAGSSTPLTQGQLDRAYALIGLPTNWPLGTLGSTQTNSAKGLEFEVTYNPKANWRMKLAVGKQKTSYSEVMPEYDAWVSQRMALWTTAKAPAGIQTVWTRSNGAVMDITNFWTGTAFPTPQSDISASADPSATNYRPKEFYESAVLSQYANAVQLQGAAPFGQRNWRATFTNSYDFEEGVLRNFGVGCAVRWEDKAVIGYYGGLNALGQYDRTDASRPIYDSDHGISALDNTHLDFWVMYRLRLWNNRVKARIQLNVYDTFEEGGLRPVYTNLDGTVAAYRIVDSRRWQLGVNLQF